MKRREAYKWFKEKHPCVVRIRSFPGAGGRSLQAYCRVTATPEDKKACPEEDSFHSGLVKSEPIKLLL